ncbi:hypothetical protein CLV99_1291 [Sphingobacterium yanglingense]|uniref:Uncharacterized protein n=2 Tax=Sphingobacterium yanglingense TaxID=1437280 RepID=A0A4R6WNY2_9SPHI|nr:hypothetical protein CLV99_1291 [Sphingobacterium yanglingense]
MSIFFDSNITFLMREEAITNSIIETKRKCDLLTHQTGSFGDLERAIYLCQQEHGATYHAQDCSAPLLLAYYLTLRRLFPESTTFAQVGFEQVGLLDINTMEAETHPNSQLVDTISEYMAYLDQLLSDPASREERRQEVLNLCEQFRFHISVNSSF